MPDHVGIGVVHDDQRVLSSANRLECFLGNLAGSHRRQLVVGAHLARGRYENAVLERKRLLAAARKKIRHVRVLFGLREPQLGLHRRRDDFAERPLFEDLPKHQRVLEARVVERHDREHEIIEALNRKLAERRVREGPR